MREFFKGWRRKTGVVTLVMALAITLACISDSTAFLSFFPRQMQLERQYDGIRVTAEDVEVTTVGVV